MPENKLAAIYNIWDGEELLEGSIKQIRSEVDLVIAIVQSESNFGEYRINGVTECNRLLKLGLIDVVEHINIISTTPMQGESSKRRMGLSVAKRMGATHFLYMDCDEYYFTNEFKRTKELFYKYQERGYEGSVCSMKTYFKSPFLMLNPKEDYYVPFIHVLKEDTETGFIGNSNKLRPYPFYCDPTRRVNVNKVIDFRAELIEMHHYSYVRKDIERKIRNSSARTNIEKTPVLQDYANAKAGYKLKYCNKSLILAENHFGICL